LHRALTLVKHMHFVRDIMSRTKLHARMMRPMQKNSIVSLGDVERETGLGKDLLRKWRSRYGFPASGREGDIPGYQREEINQLRLIRRLLDAGMRPKSVVGKSTEELEVLVRTLACCIDECEWPESTRGAMRRLRDHDLDGVRDLLATERRNRTMGDFIRNVIVPLSNALGDAWTRGEIEIYHEHLCTSLLIRQLQLEHARFSPKPGYPRFIFSTMREELHTLGLQMAQATLADLGVECIDLGPQMPVADLNMAARECKADVVALSFSRAFPARQLRPALIQLREALPATVQIWAGGSGVAGFRHVPSGIRIFSNLDEAARVINEWSEQARRPMGSAVQ